MLSRSICREMCADVIAKQRETSTHTEQYMLGAAPEIIPETEARFHPSQGRDIPESPGFQQSKSFWQASVGDPQIQVTVPIGDFRDLQLFGIQQIIDRHGGVCRSPTSELIDVTFVAKIPRGIQHNGLKFLRPCDDADGSLFDELSIGFTHLLAPLFLDFTLDVLK